MSQNLHDQSYRRLFSSPHMVRALFDGILPGSLRSQVDLNDLTPLPSNFVSMRNRDRRADCIWRLGRRDGKALYVLLLLEHQSEPDMLMSIRLMGYTALLYEDLQMRGRRKLSPAQFPAILPIVLYSGEGRWKAPLQVSDLLEPAPAGLDVYQPQMRYLLLDEGELVRRSGLPDNNLAALLFRLEHNQSLEQAGEILQTVLKLTEGAEYAELRKAFFLWVRHVLLPRSLPATVEFPEVGDLSEVTSMLTTQRRDWGYDLKQEGVQEGLKEGAAAVLEGLLVRKFGPLSADVISRVQGASTEEIHAWSLNVLDAKTLEDVFAM